ncbi:hypothetical protein [Sulfurimonas sp.]|uniref:hypothetical protein n=1 Tax=Sulfurimonas sp. TaxID=2022749 RepID=UPI002AB2676F|nr:hypothetical protein [Sulfurimonas sp.]
MQKEYDFSKGTRGKFYKKNVNFHLPIYLDSELEDFINKIANERNTTVTQVVNNLLFKDKELIELTRAEV